MKLANLVPFLTLIAFFTLNAGCTKLTSAQGNKGVAVVDAKESTTENRDAELPAESAYQEESKIKESNNQDLNEEKSILTYHTSYNHKNDNKTVDIPDIFTSKEEAEKLAQSQIESQKEDDSSEKKAESLESVGQVLFIKLVNNHFILSLNKNPHLALYKSKLMTKDTALNDLKTANEDSFCTAESMQNLEVNSVYGITSIDQKQVDVSYDLFETTLSLIDQNKRSSKIICTHSTNNFYIEQLIVNFKEEIQVFSKDNTYTDYKNFQHPRTLNRMINAIKIKNLAVLNELSTSYGKKSLLNGKVIDTNEAGQILSAGQTPLICQLGNRSKNLDVTKNYIRVGKTMGKDEYEKVILMSTTYMADIENFFTFDCWMDKKTAVWHDLLKLADGVFDFGTLNRLEYNAKYDEMKGQYEKVFPK